MIPKLVHNQLISLCAFASVATLALGIVGCGHGSPGSFLPPAGSTVSAAGTRQIKALGSTQIAIHVGGGAVGSFLNDQYGQGGTLSAFSDPITVPTGDTAPAELYQSQRFGQMTYTIPGLTARTAYVVRLHFAELWWGRQGRPGTGQRLFNIAINGAAVASNFDVFAAAGGADIAVVRDFNATSTAGGQIVIALTNGSADNPLLNGIEIIGGSAGTSATAIKVGGPAVGVFVADVDGTGGIVSAFAQTVDVSAPNAAPMSAYQTQRYGPMTYTVPGFTAGGSYIVRLHFAEMYWGINAHGGGIGSRKFNVAINGAPVLTNLDVYAKAGAADKAVVIDETANADANGTFTIALTNGAADNAMLTAIQFLPGSGGTTAQALDVGGGQVGAFTADTLPNGGANGTIATTSTAIDVSAANAAPQAVYQSQRFGQFARTVSGLTPGSAYTVRLHFAELYFGYGRAGTGQRMFNVAVNGAPVLSNFDVFATAGAANKAVVRDFPATADGNGSITVALTNGAADNPMLSGIEIIAGSVAPVAVASEMPRQSDAFVDSVGVNVHLSEYGTLYGNNFGAVQSLLQGANLRHVRDGIGGNNDSLCNEDRSLAASGIHVDVIGAWSQTDLSTWLNCIGSAAELLEGINEWDLSGDANWVADLRANEQTMAQQYPQLPLVAPALTSEGAFGALGSLANIVSFGNAHAYFAGRNPGTTGWGATGQYGTYGSLAYNLGVSTQVGGSKPILVTEAGYSDQLDQYAVPAVTKARYMVRMLLGNWNGGAARTYVYELVDEGAPNFSHYGLVDSVGNAKPAYTALASLLGHLADSGGSFSPAALSYNFVAPSTVSHTLLQRRNGSYELIVWNEVSEWNPDTSTSIATTPQTVQLTFAAPPSAIKQSTFGDSGTLTATQLAPSNNVFLSVGAWPTIVDITP